MKMSVNVFTYGTLMFPEVMEAVVGECCSAAPAKGEGLRRTRLKGKDYPAVHLCSGSVVEGVLFREVPESAVARLDYFEGDEYVRQRVWVETEQGGEEAWCYVLPEENAGLIEDAPWDPEDFRRVHLASYAARVTPYMQGMSDPE